MSFIRFNLDLAIKEPIPDELNQKFSAIKETILKLKSFASKINEGKENEEMTIRAVYHRCFHDEGKPCEIEKEI